MPGIGCTVSTSSRRRRGHHDTQGRDLLFQEKPQPRKRGDHDQHLLRVLAADPDHEDQAGAERADDRAERIRGVDAADQPRRILSGLGDRGERQRKARAPQNRARQHRAEAAHEIELELEPGIGRDRRIDRPVRQRLRQHIRGPRNRRAQTELTCRERDARPLKGSRERRSDAAADAEARQEHREDQRERVRRRAEQQRQQARPDHLRRRAPSSPTARSTT